MKYTLIVDTNIEKKSLISALEGFGIKTEYATEGDDTNRDFFMTIRWHRDDIAQALGDRGIAATEENIGKVIADCGIVEDRSVEEGWEMLDIVIRDIDFEEEE